MGLCRKIVLLGGFPVCFVHAVSSWGIAGNSPLICTKLTNLLRDRRILPGMTLDGQNLDERAIRWPIPGDKARIPPASSLASSGSDSCMQL
jgi:hypothetical protein